jgi:hypothetical protein
MLPHNQKADVGIGPALARFKPQASASALSISISLGHALSSRDTASW